jgi:hypothetical protein
VTLIKNKSGKTFSREALREEYTSILPASILGRFYRVRSWRYEQAPGANSGALIIGFLVAAIGASMSYLEAWAINPARDFGPRLFCYLAGWGNSALPSPDNYWYVPIVAPLIGGAVGGGAYQVLIHPLRSTTEVSGTSTSRTRREDRSRDVRRRCAHTKFGRVPLSRDGYRPGPIMKFRQSAPCRQYFDGRGPGHLEYLRTFLPRVGRLVSRRNLCAFAAWVQSLTHRSSKGCLHRA